MPHEHWTLVVRARSGISLLASHRREDSHSKSERDDARAALLELPGAISRLPTS